jgi:2-dehydropantoate 2-reductase
MRYVIVGAGAIGATIGGLLAESGQEVLLIARGAHLDALRNTGLRLAMPERELHLPLPAFNLTELELAAGDVLILTVKSQHSAEVLTQLARLPIGSSTAGQDAHIFCGQNGVSNEPAALRFFAHVHGGSVNLPATHLQPGQIDAEGSPFSGVIQVGRYPNGSDDVDVQVAADLNAANITATVRADVMPWKRAKLLRNLGNALEVLTGPAPDQRDARREVRARLMQEGRDCFAAAGLAVIDEVAYDTEIGARAQPTVIAGRTRPGGSTWQSVQRGQGSVETDFLNGEIVRLGRVHGVATPVNEAVQVRMWAVMRGIANGNGNAPIDPAHLLG